MSEMLEQYPAVKIEGVPTYWIRAYDSDRSFIMAFGVDQDGVGTAVISPMHNNHSILYIYGYTMTSSYEEDKPYERQRLANGDAMTVCFSRVEPRGELGFTPVAEMKEISEYEFLLAMNAGWPDPTPEDKPF